LIVITACSVAERVWIPHRADVRRVRTRMGDGAGSSLNRFLSRIDPPQAIVGTGFCGGLSPDLRTGTAVIGKRVIQRGEEIAVSCSLVESAQRALDATGIPYMVGSVITTTRVAASEAEKNALADTGAIAVDMESGALARIADRYGIPFLPLRIVLDEQRDPLPFGNDSVVAGQVLAHPLATLRTLRLVVIAGGAIWRAMSAVVDSLTPRSERCVAQ